MTGCFVPPCRSHSHALDKLHGHAERAIHAHYRFDRDQQFAEI